MHVTAIVVAAGEGRRIGGDVSKTYLPIAGRPLVLRTLDRMFSTPGDQRSRSGGRAETISSVAIVAARGCGISNRAWLLQSGGATRQQSVQARFGNGWHADADIVVIHDGARPFVSAGLYRSCIEAAAEKERGCRDCRRGIRSKFVAADGWIQRRRRESRLWEIQTPQVFRNAS